MRLLNLQSKLACIGDISSNRPLHTAYNHIHRYILLKDYLDLMGHYNTL